MSAIALLLGTRRLRREIEVQTQQLHLDRQNEKLARTQLRATFVQRAVSPLGLFSTVAVGFVAGKVGAGPPNTTRAVTQTIASATTLAIAALRSAGVQMVLPMLIEWFQSKVQHQNGRDSETPAQSSVDSNNLE